MERVRSMPSPPPKGAEPCSPAYSKWPRQHGLQANQEDRRIAMPGMMKAAVIREPGGPEVLKIEHMRIPAARSTSRSGHLASTGRNCSPGRVWMSKFRAFSASRRSGLWRTRPLADPGTIGQDAVAVGNARRRAGDAADLVGVALPRATFANGERLLTRGGTTSVELAAYGDCQSARGSCRVDLAARRSCRLARSAGADRST
jgi:hypothetical protein